jgi:tRNA-splicing ligase RtcB
MGPSKRDFLPIGECLWELPTSFHSGMKVPVWLIADEILLEDALGDLSLTQAVNVACLPGLVGRVVVMPDVHQGYGMPIGGVMATHGVEGMISPGAVGYDINCGVRLLASKIEYGAVERRLPDLAATLYRNCPSGVGEKGHVPVSVQELEILCVEGARWALRRAFAREEDLARTEESGCLQGADPSCASARAKERGRAQVGTLGAGNHFIEVDVVDQVFDDVAAEVMGLQSGTLAVQIHCGSRGFGHQICTDYVQDLQAAVSRYHIVLPDRELVCAPLGSPEGKAYLGAMKCAANFAFANRQVLAFWVRRSFEEVLSPTCSDWDLHQVYDIAHNMAKMEDVHLEGRQVRACVHRKGATRAFGPGFQDLPEEYRRLGQPVLVPGSMGTASWVLLGADRAMEIAFGSTCHGAGRLLSRAQAKRQVRGEKLRSEMGQRGIHVRAGSVAGLAEEAPQAYKDVDRVVDVVCRVQIARKVARLRPVAVVKG